MLFKNVRIGEVVEIGDVAAIRIDDKQGRMVRLCIAALSSVAIRVEPTGIIAPRFTGGIVPPAPRPIRILESAVATG